MSNILWKNFNICFSKFKCLPTLTFSPQPRNPDDEEDEEIYHFPTDINHDNNNNPSSLLIKNFNSLYDDTNSDMDPSSKSLTFSSTITTATTSAAAATEDFFSSSSDYDSDTDLVPDFSSAFASHRFFFSSPGTSNSIFENPQGLPPPQEIPAAVSGGVAVHTYSTDPYSDFKKSMLEMIEARETTNVKDDWEFLHELLLCYLTLNPKHTHKFIIGAFADVVVDLISPVATEGNRRKAHLQQELGPKSLLPV